MRTRHCLVTCLVVLSCAMSIAGSRPLAAAEEPKAEASGKAAGHCDFQVNDVSGVTPPWPLVGGLPLPQGAVRNAAKIRVVDERSHEVPAQVDVAATYRDGSIRWALLSFAGSPRERYRAN